MAAIETLLRDERRAAKEGQWENSEVVMRVTVSGDLTGEYVVEEIREDGRVVLRPDTDAEAIDRRLGLEPIHRRRVRGAPRASPRRRGAERGELSGDPASKAGAAGERRRDPRAVR
jgi:hypothetical protein